MLTKACLSHPNAFHSRRTKPPSSQKCKKHRMWELGRHDRWSWHTKPSDDGKIDSFVVVESLFDASGTLRERLDWKTPCLMHTFTNQLRSSHKDTQVFYASVDGLSLCAIKSLRSLVVKSAWRGHTRCSVQIVTKLTYSTEVILDVLCKSSQN